MKGDGWSEDQREAPIPDAALPAERWSCGGRLSSPTKHRGNDTGAVHGPTLSTTPAFATAPATRVRATRECCWPLGEPGARDFRFCGADAEPGKSYCAQHCERAFVRVRPREEVEAQA